MSRLIRYSPASRSAKARRKLRALRKSCTQARLTDRELMALRTNLSRHSGWGAVRGCDLTPPSGVMGRSSQSGESASHLGFCHSRGHRSS
jgi:hypothetical protein